ncbi:MAG: NifB/NifX family molybdenum-iron cluster-binding protein [Candidatus Omnitrophota bacterium]
MRIGITLDEDKGLESAVSSHFGQCGYFLIADVEGLEIKNAKVMANNASHGGGGCVAVDEMLKYNVTHVISGGMGMGAQQKFAMAGVKVSGYAGKAVDAIKELVNNNLDGLGACGEHGDCH